MKLLLCEVSKQENLKKIAAITCSIGGIEILYYHNKFFKEILSAM
jgi:hypothetical protein